MLALSRMTQSRAAPHVQAGDGAGLQQEQRAGPVERELQILRAALAAFQVQGQVGQLAQLVIAQHRGGPLVRLHRAGAQAPGTVWIRLQLGVLHRHGAMDATAVAGR